MATDSASSKHYKELGRRGGELAVLYQDAVKARKSQAYIKPIATELTNIIMELAINFLRLKVGFSRTTLSGVPANLDEEDILQDLLLSVFGVLNAGKYVDKGEFRAWILKIATNLFLDSLNYKKSKQDPTQKEKDQKEADALDAGDSEKRIKGREENGKLDEEGEADAIAALLKRGASSARNVILPIEVMREDDDGERSGGAYEPEGQGGSPANPEGSLINRELLNLILDGLRSIELGPSVEVWVARVFLGHGEAEIYDFYGFGSNTATSHFRRASMDILAFINKSEGYKDLSLKGLREIVLDHPLLEDRDLQLLGDERQREVLRHAIMPGMTVAQLGELMGLTKKAAIKILRDAIVALSQAKVKRAQPLPLGQGTELDAWLWGEVGRILASYPKPPEQVRGESSMADGELSALCQVSVMLAYSRAGVEPPKGFGELVSARVEKDGFDVTAKALGLGRAELRRIMAGSVGPEQMGTDQVARLASHFGMDPRSVITALTIAANASPGGSTRGLTPQDHEKRLESFRQRILSHILVP